MTDSMDGRLGNRWRIPMWSALAALELLPLAAMRFTSEVAWTGFDFLVFGVMLAVVGGGVELAARLSRHYAYRAASGVALVAGFLLVWINLAVGIIGNEDNPLNLMYGGVLVVGLLGAAIARFRPLGMARALVAMAVAQVLVAVAAQVAGHFTWVLTAVFVAIWLGSAGLYRKAARDQAG